MNWNGLVMQYCCPGHKNIPLVHWSEGNAWKVFDNIYSPTPPCPTPKGVRDHIELCMRDWVDVGCPVPWGTGQAKSKIQNPTPWRDDIQKGVRTFLQQDSWTRDLVFVGPLPAGAQRPLTCPSWGTANAYCFYYDQDYDQGYLGGGQGKC
jgi:hypothetical protein